AIRFVRVVPFITGVAFSPAMADTWLDCRYLSVWSSCRGSATISIPRIHEILEQLPRYRCWCPYYFRVNGLFRLVQADSLLSLSGRISGFLVSHGLLGNGGSVASNYRDVFRY